MARRFSDSFLVFGPMIADRCVRRASTINRELRSFSPERGWEWMSFTQTVNRQREGHFGIQVMTSGCVSRKDAIKGRG